MLKSKVFSREDLIVFTRQLALIIDSDISLYEGLKLIADKSDNLTMKKSIDLMLEKVGLGHSLSEAMAEQSKEYPDFIRTMIKIGEESGELSSTLEQIATTYERELDTASKVRSAITYPIILTIMMFAVIVILVVKVLPIFNNILKSTGGELPPFTRFMMSISLGLGQNLIWISIGIIILALLIFYFARSKQGKEFFDRIIFKLPILGEITSAMTAVRFSRNLSILLKSGVNTSLGMKLLAPIFENSYVESKINLAAQQIDQGESVDNAIEKLNLFPWVLIKLFSVAQMTGHMDNVLDKAANAMESELDYRLDRLTTVIEPILIIILSCIVGVILISVILPIIGIMNNIG